MLSNFWFLKSLIDLYTSHHPDFVLANVLRNITRQKRKSKILKLLWNILYKYRWDKQKKHDYNEIVWLNEHIEKESGYKNLQITFLRS